MRTLLLGINSKYIHPNMAIRLLKVNCDYDVSLKEYRLNELEKFDNFTFIKVIYYLTIVLAFGALAYSLATEFDSYIQFFSNPDYENSVKSFFIQKNNYGVILRHMIDKLSIFK